MISRSPYLILFIKSNGKWIVTDPARHPIAGAVFDKQIDAINYSTRLWDEDFKAKESEV